MVNLEGRRVVLITGASTVVGLATARRMLEDGLFVILTARESSLARLNQVSFLKDPANHWVRPLEVTNALQRRELIDEIDRKLGRLDILVNNAGTVYRTPIEFAYDFESKEQMQINFHAPIELIKICLPLMRRQGSGHIINVSSAAGFLAIPTLGLYAASKHALEGASEALQHELRPWNIHLTLVQPGFVTSPAYARSHLGLAFARHWREVLPYKIHNHLVSTWIERAVELTTSTPEKVAGAICRVAQMRRPPLRVQVTLDARVFSFLKRFLPDSAFDRLMGLCLKTIARQTEVLPQGT
jgi:NAD(P)-dependent dehydrogenase (short-subunit alcohol dehydrogenase family)